MRRLKGFTLIEICVSVLIGSIILIALTKMLSGGMKSSQKGAAHLTNLQTTAILLTQIESDLQQAVDLSNMSLGTFENSAKIGILQATGAGVSEVSVIYQVAPDAKGVTRTYTEGSSTKSHTFCKGLMILNCQFKLLHLPNSRVGFWVNLKTGTPPKGTEEFEIKRFFWCPNHASNSQFLGWAKL